MAQVGLAKTPQGGLNGRFHRIALNAFMAVVLAHWAEHLAQAYQIWVLHWPLKDSRGVLGLAYPLYFVGKPGQAHPYDLVQYIVLVWIVLGHEASVLPSARCRAKRGCSCSTSLPATAGG